MAYEISPFGDLDRLLPATRTTRPDIARSHLSAIFADHDLKLRAGRVDFSHQQADLCDTSIGILRYGTDVEIVAPALDFYVLQLTLDGEVAFRTAQFETLLSPGTLFVMNPGLRYRKTWSRDAQQLMIKIPNRRLQAHAARCGQGARPVRFPHEPSPLTQSQGLVDLIAYLCRDLGHAQGLCGREVMRRNMEDVLLSALLTTQGLGGDEAGSEPFHLHRAEEYIRAHRSRPVSLSELVAIAGVSERTLQQSFLRHRGQSPSEFSRDLRLDLAREAIASRGDASVTQIALEFGFNHFGRFAQSYGARFGEKPSETLRRARH
jgi:AraC-like DNA-binding protein